MSTIHRRSFIPADDGGVVIQVVIFDFLRTVLLPKVSYGEQLARIYEEICGICVTPRRALEVTERVHRNTCDRTEDPDFDWIKMNRRILGELSDCAAEKIPEEIARQVRPRVIGIPGEGQEEYQVKPSMRRLLMRLARRLPLGLATTQPRDLLDQQLGEFDLAQYFDPSLVFCSHGLVSDGLYVHKPTAKFWSIVRKRIGADAEEIPLVGDSLATDAPAANFGHPVLLYDSCGHQTAFLPPNKPVYLCSSTVQIEARLRALGLP